METGACLSVAEGLALAQRYRATRDFAKAMEILHGLIQRNPTNRDVLVSLSRLSDAMGNPGDGLALIRLALAYYPDDMDCALEEASLLERSGQLLPARDAMIRVAQRWPESPLPLLRLGYFLRRMNQYGDAEQVSDLLVSRHPDFFMGWVSRGIGQHSVRRLTDAAASFDRAAALEPDNAVVHFSRATNLLAMGQFAEGWREFEWRLRLPDAFSPPVSVPKWTKQAVDGARVLVWNDQGFGDAIQFFRFLPALCRAGALPVLYLSPCLTRLASAMFPHLPVVSAEETPPTVDYHLPVMSLADALGCGDQISSAPYVSASGFADAAASLAALPGLRVGLVWAGGARTHDFDLASFDGKRSLSLDSFRPLFSVPGVSFVSLQMGATAEAELTSWPSELPILNPMADVRDFADTAALISSLDLVISVDTAVVHLAGALGKPVWILSRFNGCWRWMTDRTDSPWYADAKVFRQEQPGQWEPVIDSVVAALQQAAQAHTRP